MDYFAPRLDILPPAQQRVWGELGDIPAAFTLYGGTAIALHLGHRRSIDFDFFGAEYFDPLALRDSLPLLSGARILQMAPNTLTCPVDRDGWVQLSFVGVPAIGKVDAPCRAPDIGLNVARLRDLAGMKVAVVQRRAELKDYLDIDALIRAGIDLPSAGSAAQIIYGPGFNAQISVKALAYFDEGDVAGLPADNRQHLLEAVAAVDLDNLPTFSPHQTRAKK